MKSLKCKKIYRVESEDGRHNCGHSHLSKKSAVRCMNRLAYSSEWIIRIGYSVDAKEFSEWWNKVEESRKS